MAGVAVQTYIGYAALTTKPVGDSHLYYVCEGQATYNSQTVTATWSSYGITGLVGIQGVGGLIPISNLHVAYTNDNSQIDMTGVDAIKAISVTATTPSNSLAYYAVSIDQRQTWLVWDGAVIRGIAKLDAGTWWYRNAGGAWVDTGETTAHEALRLAFAIAANQMTGAEMAAATETDWADIGGYPTLDFALGIQADGDDVPTVTSFSATVYDTGTSDMAGWSNGGWSEGVGWTDNTVDGVSFGKDGTIVYGSAAGFTADYSVIAGIPGYWFRTSIRGTSIGTTLTKVRYQAPCQDLQSIGDGQPDTVLGFVFHDVSAGKILDFSIEMSDNTYTQSSSAEISFENTDYLYEGYLTRFNSVLYIFGATNNNVASVQTREYWNGLAWVPLTIVDGTSEDGKTFRKQGEVEWTAPSDWKSNIPVPGLVFYNAKTGRMEPGYWTRTSVSVNLTASVMFAECRVMPVPTALPKHKHVAAFQNRIVLANQPSAPDQMICSSPFLEYCWTGPNSASYRAGNGAINAMLDAWNTLLAAQPERWTMLTGVTGAEGDMLPVEAARHIPINTRVIVKAPMSGADDGSRPALFFINRHGGYAATGLQADASYATARHEVLSGNVNWWDETALPRLDLDYLHLACGAYLPERNWIIWAVPMIVDSPFDSAAVVQEFSGTPSVATGRVKLPITGGTLIAGQTVTITGTANYNGSYTLHTNTSSDYLVFTAPYTAETLTPFARYYRPGVSQTTNNRLIVFDLTLGAWLPPFDLGISAMTTAYHYNANASGKLGTLGLYGSDYSGRILRLFGAGADDDNGTAISGYIETGWLNFGESDSYTELQQIWAYGKTASSVTLSVGRRWFEATNTYDEYFSTTLTDLLNPTGEFAIATQDYYKQGNMFKFRLDFSDVTEIRNIQPIIPKDTDGGKYR